MRSDCRGGPTKPSATRHKERKSRSRPSLRGRSLGWRISSASGRRERGIVCARVCGAGHSQAGDGGNRGSPRPAAEPFPRDPADRLIASTAMVEGMPLGPRMRGFGTQRCWLRSGRCRISVWLQGAAESWAAGQPRTAVPTFFLSVPTFSPMLSPRSCCGAGWFHFGSAIMFCNAGWVFSPRSPQCRRTDSASLRRSQLKESAWQSRSRKISGTMASSFPGMKRRFT